MSNAFEAAHKIIKDTIARLRIAAPFESEVIIPNPDPSKPIEFEIATKVLMGARNAALASGGQDVNDCHFKCIPKQSGANTYGMDQEFKISFGDVIDTKILIKGLETIDQNIDTYRQSLMTGWKRENVAGRPCVSRTVLVDPQNPDLLLPLCCMLTSERAPNVWMGNPRAHGGNKLHLQVPLNDIDAFFSPLGITRQEIEAALPPKSRGDRAR